MALTVKHRVSLDLSLGAAQATVPFRRGDGAAHEVIFSLRYGSEPIELPVGTVAVITVLNGADGDAGVADMCVVDHVSGTVSYSPTKSALSVAGSITCELEIVGAGGERLGAPRFIFFVDETMLDESESEIAEALKASDSWGVIQSTKQNAEDAAASKEAAFQSSIISSAWATGEFITIDEEGNESSTEVHEGDPPYQNNAKYYAGQAKDSKVEAGRLQNEAQASAESAALWATGEYTTVDEYDNEETIIAGEDAPQFKNNAKYYAGVAQACKEAIEGASLVFEMNESTYELTAKFVDSEGNEITSATVDLPLESMVVGIEDTYDDKVGTSVRFVLRNGSYSDWFTLDDMISGFVTKRELESELNNRLASKANQSDVRNLENNIEANTNTLTEYGKRIESLESFKSFIGSNLFITALFTYSGTVPARSAKYAVIDRLGCTVKTVKSYGANLLDGNALDTTVNGVTFTKRVDDGAYVLSTDEEPPTATASARIYEGVLLGDGDTITVSIYGSTPGTRVRVGFIDESGGRTYAPTLDYSTQSITIKKSNYPNAVLMDIVFAISAGTVINGAAYIMVVNGDTPVKYYPFTTGTIDTYEYTGEYAGTTGAVVDFNKSVVEEGGEEWPITFEAGSNFIKVQGAGKIEIEYYEYFTEDGITMTYQEGDYVLE